MSHEFNPTGEGSKTGKLGSQPEQQPVPVNTFDSRIKALFANRDYYSDSERTSALERVESTLASDDRFTDNWWEGLYKWLDQMNYHREKNQVAEAAFDALSSFPKDAKLPRQFGYWASSALEDPQLKERMVNTLDNSAILSFLREQIPVQLARHPSIWGLHIILKGYKLFGEPVGQEMRKNIVPIFMSGLATKEVFDANKDVLVQLYADPVSHKEDKTDVKTARKSPSIVSRISRYFKKPEDQGLSSSTSVTISDRKREEGERRIVAIRDLVRELYPTHEEYYNRWEELSRHLDEFLKSTPFPDRLELTEDESSSIERLGEYERKIQDQCINNMKVSQDASSLPIDTLETYLSDIRQLRTIPNFGELASFIIGGRMNRGIAAPYSALGRACTVGSEILPISVLNHLNELDQSGRLDDRVADEVLLGVSKELSSDDQIKPVARRNLRILIGYQLPQNTNAYDFPRLLTIPEEDSFKNRIDILKSITTAYENHEKTFIPVTRLVYADTLSGERALELPTQANDILENPSLFSLAVQFPQTFLTSDQHTEFFRKIVNGYASNEQHIKDISKAVQDNHISRDMALAFPQQAPGLMQDKMKESRIFVWNNGKTLLKDVSDLKFLNRLVGEFGQKSDTLIRGYQECLEAGKVTTEEKELVLEFAKQFRVVAPATLAGYKEAKQGGFEKGYIAQLKTLAEKMTGSGTITEEERNRPYYKDLLKHVYSNNAGQWSSFESNDSCVDRSGDLAGFKINPRYEIDLLSQSEIRIKAGETPNPSVQDEVQRPIIGVAEKMNALGHDKEKINLALKEDIDKTLREITEKGGLPEIDLSALTSTEERMFLVLTDSIYGTRSIDPKRVKDLVTTYEFATFEDISDYMAGTRDRVGRANNQDYALLCEVGAFYSDRIKEVNRRLVEEAYKNPQIEALMPEYFRKLSQDSAAGQKQDRINRLQIDRLGASESFVKHLTSVLEKRRGRKYEPEEVKEIIRRYEGLTGGLQEKASSSQNPQTRAFYGQLRSQREKSFEALRIITGEEVDPQKVHLGEINLQHVLETETGIKEGKYDEGQFASYTAQRFIDLFEDERMKIEGELAKFESISGKQREVLYGYITKTKESANARMVGGVCVAGDNPSKNKDRNMWDMPNYFQLVFQEPDTLQCQGLVLLHHFTQDGKKVLAASLNPSSTYVYSVDETALFSGIMGTLEQFAKDNNIDMITFSQNKTIRTNRTAGQFEKTMDARIASVDKKFTFISPQTFSYTPNYQLQDMDVAWERSL